MVTQNVTLIDHFTIIKPGVLHLKRYERSANVWKGAFVLDMGTSNSWLEALLLHEEATSRPTQIISVNSFLLNEKFREFQNIKCFVRETFFKTNHKHGQNWQRRNEK